MTRTDTVYWTAIGLQHQHRQWDFGYFELLKRTQFGARTQFRLELKGNPTTSASFFPTRFFFDEEFAKQEVESWINNWAGQHALPLNPCLSIGAKVWSVIGRNCTLSLFALRERPLLLGNWLILVRLNDQVEPNFLLHLEDLAPRCYFNETIALAEGLSWLSARHEFDHDRYEGGAYGKPAIFN